MIEKQVLLSATGAQRASGGQKPGLKGVWGEFWGPDGGKAPEPTHTLSVWYIDLTWVGVDRNKGKEGGLQNIIASGFKRKGSFNEGIICQWDVLSSEILG